MSKKDKKANKALSEIAKMLVSSKKEIRTAKLKQKEAQCECLHKSAKGKLYLRPMKEDKTIFRCKECRDKVYLSPIAGMNSKELKKYIKETCKGYMNLCNILKIVISEKDDEKYAKAISKSMFSAYKIQKFAKMALADGFTPKAKNKNKGKGRSKNFTFSGGGSTL